MNHLILYAHPNPNSFNHAILETVQSELAHQGHEVRVRDLYQLKFNPVLSGDDFVAFQQNRLPADIEEEQQHITWAEHIVVVYPVWWAGLPAILKGYIERVFSYGFAYKYGEQGNIEQLLNGKAALLISTHGNSEENYRQSGMYEAMKKTSDYGIFEFVGMKVLAHSFPASVTTVDDAARKSMLSEVQQLLKQLHA